MLSRQQGVAVDVYLVDRVVKGGNVRAKEPVPDSGECLAACGDGPLRSLQGCGGCCTALRAVLFHLANARHAGEGAEVK